MVINYNSSSLVFAWRTYVVDVEMFDAFFLVLYWMYFFFRTTSPTMMSCPFPYQLSGVLLKLVWWHSQGQENWTYCFKCSANLWNCFFSFISTKILHCIFCKSVKMHVPCMWRSAYMIEYSCPSDHARSQNDSRTVQQRGVVGLYECADTACSVLHK